MTWTEFIKNPTRLLLNLFQHDDQTAAVTDSIPASQFVALLYHEPLHKLVDLIEIKTAGNCEFPILVSINFLAFAGNFIQSSMGGFSSG